ncbi:MAG: serine hydrolase domain-containing protein [Acidimicrobiales bacterium]
MEEELDHAVLSPGFEPVAEAARRQLAKAGGGALCVYVGGEPALDLWAGYRDPAAGSTWQPDTMAMAWSTAKGVASTALHMLADRGQLTYDDPVVRYWPEYGENGKRATTIRHLLSMEAGLYDIRHLIDDPRLMLDHEAMADALAKATPAHRPGQRNGYHAFTYGWLIGEVVRRVTGVSLGSFVQSEMVVPLGLDGFHIGTPRAEHRRVAALPSLPPLNPSARLAGKAVNPLTTVFGISLHRYAAAFIPVDAHEVLRMPEFLEAEVPAVNGVFTARSLARFYAALGSDDGVDGVRLWSPETRRAAATEQNDRRDRVISIRMRWRLGYHQPFPRKKASPDAFGFYGAFGSGAFADPSRNLAVGLTLQEARGLPLIKLMGPIVQAVDQTRRRR